MGSAGSLGRIIFPIVAGLVVERIAFFLGGILALVILLTLYTLVRLKYVTLDHTVDQPVVASPLEMK